MQIPSKEKIIEILENEIDNYTELGPDGLDTTNVDTQVLRLAILYLKEDNNMDLKWKNKYPVITLCGSTRFKPLFEEANRLLTLKGCIVISVGCFGHAGDVFTDEQKEMLDDIHKRKIDMADAIYVINKDGYIGSSTRAEIAYAKEHGKGVYYLEKVEEE